MTPIQKLEEITKIQISDGNWNCNAYMLGMANGLILALATVRDDDGEVPFLSAPGEWLDDKPRPALTEVVSDNA